LQPPVDRNYCYHQVFYVVAAGDGLSRLNRSATACSTTVPLKKRGLSRVCSIAAWLGYLASQLPLFLIPIIQYQPCAAKDLVDLGKSDTALTALMARSTI
jgi:hypothetical protein